MGKKLTVTNSVEILSQNVMEINRKYISWAKQKKSDDDENGGKNTNEKRMRK